MNLCDVQYVKKLMKDHGIQFKHKYGQNFLVNRYVITEIAEQSTSHQDSIMLEIGPGVGTLTQELASRYERVISVEIDESLLPVLAFTLKDYSNVIVVNTDFMKVDIAELLKTQIEAGKHISVCANIPYYITSPILMKLLESGVKFDNITIMIQEEVATRLCAAPGASEYGAITAVLNYYGIAKKIMRVPASDFVPAPNVDSAVIKVELYPTKKYFPKDETLFFDLIHAAFQQRRKTLCNAISNKYPEIQKEELTAILKECQHRPDIRGEKLSTADYVQLSDKVRDLLDSKKTQ